MMLSELLTSYRVILASASPRRHFLLSEMGIQFEIVVTDVSEEFDEQMPPPEVAMFLSKKKADFFLQKKISNNDIIITVDTLVSLNGEIISKPETLSEAVLFLNKLSGNMHYVYSGVTLMTKEKSHTFLSETKVYFRTLSNIEIEYYVSLFKPLDKAGGYGIQEWIGYVGIERIEGSFFNVMGLPTTALYKELSAFLKQ
jgi:septum formation protein